MHGGEALVYFDRNGKPEAYRYAAAKPQNRGST
jgi:hypothetical protein